MVEALLQFDVSSRLSLGEVCFEGAHGSVWDQAWIQAFKA